MDTLNLIWRYFRPYIFGLNFADEGKGESEGREGDGAGTQGKWTDTLPAEIKSHPVLQKYKNSTEAVKALVEAQSLIGSDKIIIPSKDAKEEEWNTRVWDRLGRPKDAAGYVLPTDLQIPEDLPIDDVLVNNFKATAHKHGLLPHQVNALYKWFITEQIGQLNNLKQAGTLAKNEAESKLRKDWGAAFSQNVALGEKVLDAFAEPETITFIKSNGLHNDASFIRFLHKIGAAMSEDQLVGKARGLTLTPEQAQVELDKIKNDLKHPYYDERHPEHKAAVEKVQHLIEMTTI